MKKNNVFVLLTLVIFLISTGCDNKSISNNETESSPETLTVMTHDSFAVSEPVISNFEEQNNVKIKFLPSGDTGSALNRAILTKDAAQADVFYGVDNTFLSRALKENLFETYNSPLLDAIPDQFKLDPKNYLLPVDYGDVCVNYDKQYFKEHNLSVPDSLENLTNPAYKGLFVMENPATSSPGLAFMLATISEFGEDGYLKYWKSLKDNGLVVVNDWETAYYTNFSGSSGQGSQPMVVSYGTSPAAEVIFSDPPREDAPTASITAPNACFRQIEFVGILKGTPHRQLAEKFIDYMLDVQFQEDVPLQMFVFPVNPMAKLPDAFINSIQIPDKPAMLDPNLITDNREKWINDWVDTVLR